MGKRKSKKALTRQQREAKNTHVQNCISLAKEVRDRPIPLTITRQEIFAARTPAGGWTRATLASWGVDWPPRAGWIERLEAGIKDEIWGEI